VVAGCVSKILLTHIGAVLFIIIATVPDVKRRDRMMTKIKVYVDYETGENVYEFDDGELATGLRQIIKPVAAATTTVLLMPARLIWPDLGNNDFHYWED